MRYLVVELKTPYDQRVVFDGRCTKKAALAMMYARHLSTGNWIVVTRGKDPGRFVAEAR